MDHRFLKLSKPNFLKWLFFVLLDWGIIITTMIAANHIHNAVFYVFAVLVVGTRQHALSIIGHDGAHLLASRNRKLNDWATCILIFWPLGIGLEGYRKFHFKHHKMVGTTHDPELEHKLLANPQWDLPAKNIRHFLHFLKDLIGLSCIELIRLMKIVKPMNLQDKTGPVLWWSLIMVLSVYFQIYFLIVLWFSAVVSSFWAVFRLRVWIEHIGTEETHRVSANTWQKLLFAPHNSWCHYEHHKYPNIPFYNLPKVRILSKDKEEQVISITKLFKSFRSSAVIKSGYVVKQSYSNNLKIQKFTSKSHDNRSKNGLPKRKGKIVAGNQTIPSFGN